MKAPAMTFGQACEKLSSRTWHARAAAVEAVGKGGDRRAVRFLVRALRDKSYEVRAVAACAIRDNGIRDKRAVKELTAALKDKELPVRMFAAEALSRVGGLGAVAPLLRSLADQVFFNDMNAANALGRMGYKRAVRPLICLLSSHQEYRVRMSAAMALGQIHDRHAIKPLIAALGGDSSPDVRYHAAWALSEFGGPDTLAALFRALEDFRQADSDMVRENAVRALGKLKHQSAVVPLEALLKREKDLGVLDLAKTALQCCREPNSPMPEILLYNVIPPQQEVRTGDG